MSYMTPLLLTVGNAAHVVLGNSTGPADNSEGSLPKGADIPAGLDE